MPERPEDVKPILDMAQRSLKILEKKMVAFGDLEAPGHLVIQFEDAKVKVQELEERYDLARGILPKPPATSQVPETPSTHPQVQSDPAQTISIQPQNSGEKPPRTKVFISYSHKDSDWLVKLKPHLEFLEKKGLLDRWDDTKIRAGMKWRDEIDKALAATKVAVLLVSADFLNSDFIQNKELPNILTAEDVTVLPVILRPCLYEYSEIKEFQWVSGPSKPLSGMSETAQEEVFVSLAKAIMDVLK